ncbi:tRNA threonylcarbamoyladenosine dehydratase [Methylobacillus flagellatus]|uniref:UBA/THIF-type NAD/FAD binding fold protein n=1 Tax=Methylobacillus flagellatus (strain ATCC 51484 / DSM 6875 / VKM B-1610 / KT) TaxID=265072 RepID=Q1H2K5_METFK|nr:tRNA threonylcarbamoyladenosine dehydratase [Methylobacillus flagellatus]ABE49138.1 UBA/THIF-type NAD/FAD binding fold protein [Methylobacillus flagellatus KT]ABE49282.1 UBA/THIF-type NAD/FAD binding fold protein [Methylobacillus flagellatus KT]
MDNSIEMDWERRFGGVRRLYGELALHRFRHAHVAVIGMGGVGSWAVEALARSAIGKLTLVDLDNIAESNVNRQLHAVEGAFGLAKVTAMAQRVREINPLAEVREVEDFIASDNLDVLLDSSVDAVLDAIDDARAKVALAAWCRKLGIPLVMAGGAGGRVDPTRIRVADLADVHGDRLLAKVRNQLRRDHGFPKGLDGNKPGSKKKLPTFGIACVYSDEPVQQPETSCNVEAGSITGLNCAGYGSSVAVTASCGMIAAAAVLKRLAVG